MHTLPHQVHTFPVLGGALGKATVLLIKGNQRRSPGLETGSQYRGNRKRSGIVGRLLSDAELPLGILHLQLEDCMIPGGEAAETPRLGHIWPMSWDRLLREILGNITWKGAFPRGSDSNESACHARNLGSIAVLGRTPGEGNGNSLQSSCLENSMDRGAWQSTVYGVTKSQT